MKRNIIYAFFVSLALMLSACGSNDKSDKSLKDFENAKVFTAEAGSLTIGNNLEFSTSIPFKKLEGSDLRVEFSNFDLKLAGCELDGPVTYSPSPLVLDGGKGSQKSITVSGKVKDDCNATGYKLSADKKITLEGQSKTTTGEDILDVKLDANGNPIGSGNPTNPNNPIVDGNFSFFNVPSSIVINKASTEYPISLQLINKALKGESGKTIDIIVFDSKFGKLKNQTVTTDSSGWANFVYTSPSDLSSIDGTTLPLTVVFDNNGTRIDSANITLSFNASATTPNSFSFKNARSIIVTAPSQEDTISIFLVDSDGIGVSGKEVKATVLSSAFGELTSGTATTDAAGKATFNYKAPENIAAINGQTENVTLTFSEDGSNKITAVVAVFIQTSASGAFSMQVIPTDANITVGEEAKPINVYVKDSAGRPAKDLEVIVEFFNQKFGTMNKYSERTDDNGRIEFVFIAPKNIEPLDGQTFDFDVSLSESPAIKQTVQIGFKKSVEVSRVSDIYIAPNDITIVRAGETRTIRITTVDSRNYAVSTSLKIENPTQNGTDYGTFDASDFTTDDFGNKEITYTAPAVLSGLVERNITVVELSTGIEKTLTIHYQQPASQSTSYTLNLSVNDSISVDGTGTLGIQIHESGKPDVSIPNADVKNVTATMKFPKMLKFDTDATSVTYANKNQNSFALHAENLSGVAIVIVEATVFDGVKDVTLRQEFPIVITSGPISSMSMFHASSSFDASKGVYQDLYTLHAVDKYGNPVNEGTALHPTLINGVKTEGTLGDIAAGNPSVFTDASADFSSVVDTNQNAGDRLIVIPATNTTSKFYLGDWSIKSHTATALTLEEEYDDVNTNGLTYVVGNENRVLVINGKSKTAIADISSPDDNFKTDAQGNMQFVVSYDPDLKGKTFYLAANGPSGEKRIGTALKSSFFYGGYQLRVLINDVTFSSPGSSFSTGFYVLDSVGNTYDGQFNVTFPTDLDPAKFSSASIDNALDTFVFTAPTDPNEFNALVGTTYEFNLTISETDETFQTIRVHYALDVNYTTFSMSSAESNFTITAPNQEYTLEYFVSDGNKAVVGEEVRVAFIDPLQGSLSSYTAITNSSGRATFTYIAPSDLSLLFANPLTINAFLSNQSSIDANVTALFVSAATTDYNLTNATTPLVVNIDNEVKRISVDVVNSNGIGIAGQDVSITVVNGVQFGSITSASTVQSDSNGRATFFYKAPASVANVDGQSTTVTLSMTNDGNTVTQDVTLNFVKIDVDTTVPIVFIIGDKERSLTSNGQPVVMEIQVLEQGTLTPYTQGNVRVSLPANVIDGVNVGRFSAYTVAVDPGNGIATFNYTAAQDLQALIDSNETNATFQFFHEDNPTNQESITVVYDLNNTYIPANYILSTSSDDDSQTMGLNELKQFTYYLKDDQGTEIPNEDITKVTITSQNTLIGKLKDETNGGNEEITLVYNGAGAVNGKSFPIQTNTISGLLPIEITVDFIDGNGQADTRTIIMNVVVFSGPPTAMSITYAGVEQNSTIAKYIEKFSITVTDTYNNPVNTRPYVAVGAMVEYAVDGSSATGNRGATSPRLWHGAFDTHGDLNTIGGDKAQFETVTDVFKYVDFDNDRLVVFGAGFVYEALGKWDIEDSGSANILNLRDTYTGSDRVGLYYAAGHNNRQNLCAGDGRENIGNMKANNYQLDTTGHALVEFEYDYDLTGKDIMIWTNLTGFQADNNKTGRIGEAQKHTLRGNGLVHEPSGGYSLLKGESGTARFYIWHENAPELYKNGHFGHAIASGSNCAFRRVKSSNHIYDINGTVTSRIDARVCNNGGSNVGSAYIEYFIQASADEGCRFNISRVNPAREFE